LFCVALKSYHDFYKRLIKARLLAGRVRRVPERELQVAAVRSQLIKTVRSKFEVEMVFFNFCEKNLAKFLFDVLASRLSDLFYLLGNIVAFYI
jgi:hypothetical protein